MGERRDWLIAGTIVAVGYAIVACAMLLPMSESTQGDLLLVLASPSMLFLFPLLLKQNPYLGENAIVFLGFTFNWFFYIAVVRWVLVRRRKSLKQRPPASPI
ncbi:MAG TPA: hypothetical protein VJO53_08125 [Candidatus Acidoferrales bacterium]|nr:hypothetical protein [Candidatus Acidoferrales bacterium]